MQSCCHHYMWSHAHPSPFFGCTNLPSGYMRVSHDCILQFVSSVKNVVSFLCQDCCQPVYNLHSSSFACHPCQLPVWLVHQKLEEPGCLMAGIAELTLQVDIHCHTLTRMVDVNECQLGMSQVSSICNNVTWFSFVSWCTSDCSSTCIREATALDTREHTSQK